MEGEKMERQFVETPTFSRHWSSMGLTDEDLREMQNFIMTHLDAKNTIPGTEGIRKIRWDARGKGKRGGVRTIYIDFLSSEEIFFLYCYPKNQQDDLSEREKHVLNRIVRELKNTLISRGR